VVEEISSLQEKMGKQLEVEFRDGVDFDSFEMEGVREVEVDGNRVSMIVTENLDEVIKEISKFDIVNMSLETFNLDQLFLTYYREDDVT